MPWEVEQPETTSRIDRDELLGLIETSASSERQRITSEIPAATLQDLLQPEEDELPVPDALACGTGPVPTERAAAAVEVRAPLAGSGTRVESRFAVVAISFLVTLVIGIATGMVAL